MSIDLQKKMGTVLARGAKISLEKAGKPLQQICVGLNWSAITKTKEFSLFSLIKRTSTRTIPVDLDGSVTLFTAEKQPLETIYYSRLVSGDGAVKHSGDDQRGDMIADEFDNEILQVDLTKLSPEVSTLVFYLNSYKGQDFAVIPYSKIRIFEGTPLDVQSVLATFNLAAEKRFRGYIAMVMGKFTRRRHNTWDFTAIGEPVKTATIEATIAHIQQHYL